MAKAMDLCLEIYAASRQFPKEELYGLTSQIRRAAVSVPSNIGEGAANRNGKQFAHFLSIAIGSLNEIDTQLDLAFRLGYLQEKEYTRIHGMQNECLALVYVLKRSQIEKEDSGRRKLQQR